MPNVVRVLHRTGLALAIASAIVAVPTAHATPTSAPRTPSPCVVSLTSPAGNASVLNEVDSNPPAGPGSVDDVDVRSATLTVSRTTIVAAITVTKLSADAAASLAGYGWGDEFDLVGNFPVKSGTTTSVANFTEGYLRSQNGGQPVMIANDVPTPVPASGRPSSVQPVYDVAHNQVTLTIPRTDLDRALGTPTGKLTLTSIGVTTGLNAGQLGTTRVGDGVVSAKPFSFAACDRALPPAPANPCVVNLPGETGDEESISGTDVQTRDDNLDVTGATMTIGKSDVTVVGHIARITNQSLDSIGGEYFFAFTNGRDDHKGFFYEALLDPVAGNKLIDPSGASRPAPAGTFDMVSSTVFLRIARADLAKVLGVPSNKLYVAAPDFGTIRIVNGTEVGADVTDGAGIPSLVSFKACDKYLAKPHPKV